MLERDSGREPGKPGAWEGVEIPELSMMLERRWLVSAVPPLDAASVAHLWHGYLVVSEGGDFVRLQARDGEYELVVKQGAGLVRAQCWTEISHEQFMMLLPAVYSSTLEKHRFTISHGESLIELDLYRGSLEGLAIAEVEFNSIEEIRDFTPPAWFGPEITEDVRYSNALLAQNGRPYEPPR